MRCIPCLTGLVFPEQFAGEYPGGLHVSLSPAERKLFCNLIEQF